MSAKNFQEGLSTQRLVLRPLTENDVHGVFSIFSHPEVTRYYEVGTMTDISEAKALLDHFISAGRYGICMKNHENIIGTCGLFDLNQAHFSASIGYDLAPEHWGRGIMSEALEALLDYGFSSLEINRINALTYPDNDLSIKLLKKFGFEKEGVMREFGFWKGSFHDMSLYSLLRSQWLARLGGSGPRQIREAGV